MGAKGRAGSPGGSRREPDHCAQPHPFLRYGLGTPSFSSLNATLPKRLPTTLIPLFPKETPDAGHYCICCNGSKVYALGARAVLGVSQEVRGEHHALCLLGVATFLDRHRKCYGHLTWGKAL